MLITYKCKECGELSFITRFYEVGRCQYCRLGELKEVEDNDTEHIATCNDCGGIITDFIMGRGECKNCDIWTPDYS